MDVSFARYIKSLKTLSRPGQPGMDLLRLAFFHYELIISNKSRDNVIATFMKKSQKLFNVNQKITLKNISVVSVQSQLLYFNTLINKYSRTIFETLL